MFAHSNTLRKVTIIFIDHARAFFGARILEIQDAWVRGFAHLQISDVHQNRKTKHRNAESKICAANRLRWQWFAERAGGCSGRV